MIFLRTSSFQFMLEFKTQLKKRFGILFLENNKQLIVLMYTYPCFLLFL